MGSIGKCFALALILTVAISGLSLIMLKPANAQSIPNPSIPEFTLRYIKASFNVTTFDTYTGANITQQIDNSTVELAIKNQPYQTSLDNKTYYLYYNIRTKSHDGQDWAEHYPLSYLISNGILWWDEPIQHAWFISTLNNFDGTRNLPASNSAYTTLAFPAKSYPINTDFQVEALIGHKASYFPPNQFPRYPDDYGLGKHVFLAGVILDTSSGWSDTQTVSLPETSPTPIPSPPISVQPTQNMSTLLIVATTIILLSTVVSLLLYRRHRRQAQIG